MATNHTANYQLNQWEATDQVLRTDFNEDNTKIDTALKSLNTTVQQHTTQLAQQAAELAKCGDCKLYYTTYVGDGQDTRTLTFPSKPLLTFLYGSAYNQSYFIIDGTTAAYMGNYGVKVSWSGNTVTLTNFSSSGHPGFNIKDATTFVLALLRAGQ